MLLRRREYKNISMIASLLIGAIIFSACSQPASESTSANDTNVSDSQTVTVGETFKTGQHECKFEELKNEVDDEGTQYRYGNLIFSVEVRAGSGSEEVDATLLAELPLILITDPDGSVRYETHAQWLTMRQKWTPSNVHYNPPWYAEVINSALWPKYSGEGIFLDFLATICNDEGRKFTFSGYVEFVPSEL